MLVEKEYKEKENVYYNKNGKVFDLIPLDKTNKNETHFVALKEVK
ncbi:hypothetical protein QQA44_02180 [Sneathia vaginalis]|nr:hypothetical protein [Sneathia vaginalis]MDK9581662.1 hypothetical protein [Sneathia vaginalis]